MDQASSFVQENSSILTTAVFLVVILSILYVVYTYLYPADDPTYTQFLKGEGDARKGIHLDKTAVPTIHTGGDMTLSMWVYIDDWNYKVSSYKNLFILGPKNMHATSKNVLVGVLTPLKNSLLVRASTTKGGVASPDDSASPDITIESTLQQLLTQQTSMQMFESTVGDSKCDVKEIPIQRWVNLTIVCSGRVLDVYMDGKLSRSCVLDNVMSVPNAPLQLRLAQNGGFGGRMSSVQMWSGQLTPDVIYGIYQMGPTQTQHNIFTDVAKYLNLNVSFTGSAPGQPISGPTNSNPFSQIYNDGSQAYSSSTADGQALMSRF
jgi:hypothetical protein